MVMPGDEYTAMLDLPTITGVAASDVRAGRACTDPMVLGAILGPLAESYFLTTMIGAQNDWTVFFTRPVSLALILISVTTVAVPLRRLWQRQA